MGSVPVTMFSLSKAFPQMLNQKLVTTPASPSYLKTMNPSSQAHVFLDRSHEPNDPFLS